MDNKAFSLKTRVSAVRRKENNLLICFYDMALSFEAIFLSFNGIGLYLGYCLGYCLGYMWAIFGLYLGYIWAIVGL